MTDFLIELDFFRREALTAQQQFFVYLALHKVPFDVPAVLDAMNRDSLLWLTVRETALQGAVTSLGRIFEDGSAHNIGALLRITRRDLGEFTRGSLAARKRRDGLSAADATTYAADKHELGSRDLRELRKDAAAMRRCWDLSYRDIRHKVYAHSEVIQAGHLFAKTNIEELVTILDGLETIYDTLWDAYYNGGKPGSTKRVPLQFPIPVSSTRLRAGEEVYRQADSVLRRLTT